ncbi:hypothetical protein C8Q76DRAFT_759510 [Earliella scabrosa]|nr:hypothetical protein C8Q76DRAFT_759510 [Earliella scabrosa]
MLRRVLVRVDRVFHAMTVGASCVFCCVLAMERRECACPRDVNQTRPDSARGVWAPTLAHQLLLILYGRPSHGEDPKVDVRPQRCRLGCSEGEEKVEEPFGEHRQILKNLLQGFPGEIRIVVQYVPLSVLQSDLLADGTERPIDRVLCPTPPFVKPSILPGCRPAEEPMRDEF